MSKSKKSGKKSKTTPLERAFQRTGFADPKGRIVLGSKFANKMFRVSEQPDGNLLLEPMIAVHEREFVKFVEPPRP